ncbi:hypothetical protein [Roseicella frigidaeris]|uniref:Uncharacterized protein n=1 Tax=Roseicella frigidaeris TaxID=2230885 RepID=A0A327M8I6_9PROT|nr:hypothetical protein [Roseicella frigidaeris]RAI59029.1 hypothetical protein DOO78_10860 [Roseicella frigidaeris]
MWTWTVEWDLALLAACMALCGLVPGVIAHLRSTDRAVRPEPARAWAAAVAGLPSRPVEGLSGPAHAAIARQVTLRMQAIGAMPNGGAPGHARGAPALAPSLALALGPEALGRIADGRARPDA